MKGRKPTLSKTLLDHDFAALAKAERNAKMKIRLIALGSVKEGKTYKEVGSSIKIHFKSIRNWMNRFSKKVSKV